MLDSRCVLVATRSTKGAEIGLQNTPQIQILAPILKKEIDFIM